MGLSIVNQYKKVPALNILIPLLTNKRLSVETSIMFGAAVCSERYENRNISKWHTL